MINRQLSRLLLCSILGSTTLISGCALVRKDSAPHQQLKPEQIKLADDIHLASSGWPQAQWWKQLNDPQLDALIQRTLSGSHTLAEAKLREEKAQSQADLLDAGSQLQVAALGMLNRQRVSANGFLSPYAMDAPALGRTGRTIRKPQSVCLPDWILICGVCIAQRLPPPLARIMPRWQKPQQ